MKKNKLRFYVLTLLALVMFSIVLAWPGGVKLYLPKPKVAFQKEIPFMSVKKDGALIDKKIDLNIKEGLDLQGGSHLVYIADLGKVAAENQGEAMDSLQKVIENRINAFGVAEPIVYTSKNGSENRLTVELPGVKDTEQAMDLIGKTAQLEFKEGNAEGTDFVSTGLTGNDFKRADVAFDQNTSAPYISIEFNDEGSKKFEEITGRNIGKPIAIYLDDKVISAPNVNQQISGGKAQITGQFEFQEAKDLSIQLNAGALPVPIKLAEQRTVGATLGQESISMSIFAGIVGIIVVSVFMMIYYRLLGVFSTIGLGLYLLFTLAIFKIIGVTLTMGGIAGLILSIGMSMETDVLIFERIREELRGGRTFSHAATLGFKRAWTSIRDSNMVSLIICALLYTAGGMVRGFALILAIGIVVGLATTFLGTRALIEIISKAKFTNKNWLFNVEKESSNESN